MLHCDSAIEGNSPPNPLELAVVQAEGRKDLDATTWPSPGSDANDFFRAASNAEFSSTTLPSSKLSDGSGSGLRVYDISAASNEMQFSVGDSSAGGSPATGGASSTGGAAAAAGTPADGGTATSGGAEPTGGLGSGGDSSTGGPRSGGSPSTGGSTDAPGTQTGGRGTGASPSSQTGALGASGGGDGGCPCSTPRRTPTPATGFLFSLGALAAILRSSHRRRRRTSRWLPSVFNARRREPASEDRAFNRPDREARLPKN